MSTRIQFEQFEFEPASGMLVRADVAGEEASVRLQPQPAQLLLLLLKNAPDIVTREEIQAKLWPDVQVDFDRNLHFCVRQVRSALGESAAEPRFIGTVPRRGYQWLTHVAFTEQTNGLSSTDGTSTLVRGEQSPRRRTAFNLRAVALLIITAVLCGLAYAASQTAPHSTVVTEVGDPATPAVRITVMPFEDANLATGQLASNGIAELLVDALTNDKQTRVEVIGPTSTERFSGRDTPLTDLVEEYEIDYILNGRILNRDGNVRLLGEVIRGTDGAHVWTKMFAAAELQQEDADQQVSAAMLNGLSEVLKAGVR